MEVLKTSSIREMFGLFVGLSQAPAPKKKKVHTCLSVVCPLPVFEFRQHKPLLGTAKTVNPRLSPFLQGKKLAKPKAAPKKVLSFAACLPVLICD